MLITVFSVTTYKCQVEIKHTNESFVTIHLKLISSSLTYLLDDIQFMLQILKQRCRLYLQFRGQIDLQLSIIKL